MFNEACISYGEARELFKYNPPFKRKYECVRSFCNKKGIDIHQLYNPEYDKFGYLKEFSKVEFINNFNQFHIDAFKVLISIEYDMSVNNPICRIYARSMELILEEMKIIFEHQKIINNLKNF